MTVAKAAGEYPSVEQNLGRITHFDDSPGWIYQLDNPY